jgi:hypothetical protein
VVQRHFSGVTDPVAGVDTWKAEDGRVLLLRVPKAQHGQRWRRLFKVGSSMIAFMACLVFIRLSGVAKGVAV